MSSNYTRVFPTNYVLHDYSLAELQKGFQTLTIEQVQRLNQLLRVTLPEINGWLFINYQLVETEYDDVPYLMLINPTQGLEYSAYAIEVDHPDDTLESMGRYLGYPTCCTEKFSAGERSPNFMEHPACGTGFVPCHQCLEVNWPKLVTEINERRISPTQFPRGYAPYDINHQLHYLEWVIGGCKPKQE